MKLLSLWPLVGQVDWTAPDPQYQSIILTTFWLLLGLSISLAGICLLGRQVYANMETQQFGMLNILLGMLAMALIFAYTFAWVIPQWGHISRFATDLWSAIQ